MGEREDLFDAWAPSYDDDVADSAGFPFEGYERALREAARLVAAGRPSSVLELGVGTGALTALLDGPGRELWGLDLSSAMVERARARVPWARLFRADALGAWPDVLGGRRFDRIVSSYLFHEFPDDRKLALLDVLAERWLVPGGEVVIADVAFGSAEERSRQRALWLRRWDDSEHYWALDVVEPAFRSRGWSVAFTPVSFCAGVVTLRRPDSF